VSGKRFLPVAQPVRAMRFTPDTAQAVEGWVNRSKDYEAERHGPFLVITDWYGHRSAAGCGDWLVLDYDGTLRTELAKDFQGAYVEIPEEPVSEEPPW
jgi:hypothetical protein